MNRRTVGSVLGLLALGLLALGGNLTTADGQTGHDAHAGHFMECAKACTACLRECESCANHCAHQVADGKKDHMRTLGTCADCAEFCASAAKIVSRMGPMSGTICESCAKACDTCGSACEKFPQDEHMKQCAKACRDCAKACRDMLKHVAPQGGK